MYGSCNKRKCFISKAIEIYISKDRFKMNIKTYLKTFLRGVQGTLE